jgi:hypothetical protein
MQKFIGAIHKSIKEEVNKWIEENIPNAGPDNFSTPLYLFPQDPDDPEQDFDECVTSWRLDPEPLQKLVDYMEATYPDKFRYSMTELGLESDRIEEDKAEIKKEKPVRAKEIFMKYMTEKEAKALEQKKSATKEEQALINKKLAAMVEEKMKVEAELDANAAKLKRK